MSGANINSDEKSFFEREVSVNFCDPTTFHDRVLLVEGKKFYVTSGLLSFASEFFRVLFNSDFKEKSEQEISLEDVKADDFDTFLHFVYPLNNEVNERAIASLMKLSIRFLAPTVWQACMEFIRNEDNFAKLNIHETLRSSEGSGSQELQARIERYWLDKFISFSENEKGVVMDSAFTHNLENVKRYIATWLSKEFDEDRVPEYVGQWRFGLPLKFNVVTTKKSLANFIGRMHTDFATSGRIALFEQTTSTHLKLYYEDFVKKLVNLPFMTELNKILLRIGSKYHLFKLSDVLSNYFIAQFIKSKDFKLVELAIDHNLLNFQNSVSEYLVSTGFDALSDREKKEIYEAKPEVQKFIIGCFVKKE